MKVDEARKRFCPLLKGEQNCRGQKCMFWGWVSPEMKNVKEYNPIYETVKETKTEKNDDGDCRLLSEGPYT